MPTSRIGNIVLCVFCAAWTILFGTPLLILSVLRDAPPSAPQLVAPLTVWIGILLLMFGPSSLLLWLSARKLYRMSHVRGRPHASAPGGFPIVNKIKE